MQISKDVANSNVYNVCNVHVHLNCIGTTFCIANKGDTTSGLDLGTNKCKVHITVGKLYQWNGYFYV